MGLSRREMAEESPRGWMAWGQGEGTFTAFPSALDRGVTLCPAARSCQPPHQAQLSCETRCRWCRSRELMGLESKLTQVRQRSPAQRRCPDLNCSRKGL